MECSSCKITYNTGYDNALGHTMTSIAEEQPTCTTNGHRKHYKCSVCGNLYLDNNGINKTTQSQVEEGYIAKGHDWETSYTSDETGHWHKCRNCDATTEKVAHVFDRESSIQYKAPTCFEDGLNYYACICGEIGTTTYKNEDKLEHAFTLVDEIPSTCKEQGRKAHKKCSRDCCKGMFFDENGNRVDKSTLLLPLADHEIIRYDVDDECHYPVCKLHGRLSGEKHNSDGKASDKDYHWTYCTVCKKQNEKHKHTFILVGKDTKCSECGYKAKDDDKSDSGFDVGVDYQTPNGSITSSKDGEVITITFKDESEKAEYKATEISWYLDNVLQEETGDTFIFTAPYKRYYSVRCSFTNKFGRGNSESLSILGGSN